MFINKDSISITVGSTTVNMGQYLVEAKYSYNKLCGSDSGRNLNGDMVASLVGIFPKLTLVFRKLTKAELEIIVPILDSPSQTVTYYDPNKQQSVSMVTYTGDYEVSNKNIISSDIKNEGFSCSFISVSKRS